MFWQLPNLQVGGKSPNDLGLPLIGYSVFLALWATCFTAAWLQRENALKHRWGTEGFEADEELLPSFHGVPNHSKWSAIPEDERQDVRRKLDNGRYLLTVLVIGMFVGGVVCTSAFAALIKAVGAQLAMDCAACDDVGGTQGQANTTRAAGVVNTAGETPQKIQEFPPNIPIIHITYFG